MAEPTILDILRAGIEAQRPQSLFDRILSGAGGGLGLGLGLSQLGQRPTTTETRSVAPPSSAERTGLASLEALQGALFSDLGLRRFIGPGGNVALASTGVPRSPLDIQGERIGMEAGRRLGVGTRLTPEGRQQLIQRLSGRGAPSAELLKGQDGTFGLPSNVFTGTSAGLDVQPPAVSSRVSGGPSTTLPILGTILGAAAPIAKELGLFKEIRSALGLGGTGAAAGAAGTGTANLLAGIDKALGLEGAPLDAFLAEKAAEAGSGFSELAGSLNLKSLAPVAAGAGATAGATSAGTQALLSQIDKLLGITQAGADAAIAAPPVAGFPALATAAASGGTLSAAPTLSLGGFLSGAGQILGPFAAIPAIAAAFGAFRGPNRSEQFRTGFSKGIRPVAEETLGPGGVGAITSGGMGNLWQDLRTNMMLNIDPTGVGPNDPGKVATRDRVVPITEAYLRPWTQAVNEAAVANVGGTAGVGDTDRAAAIIMGYIFSKNGAPEEVVRYLADLGASEESTASAFMQSKDLYDPGAMTEHFSLMFPPNLDPLGLASNAPSD